MFHCFLCWVKPSRCTGLSQLNIDRLSACPPLYPTTSDSYKTTKQEVWECLVYTACRPHFSVKGVKGVDTDSPPPPPPPIPAFYRLVGLVVRRPPRERKIPGSSPVCAGIFSGSSHTSDSKNWHSSGYPSRRLA